MSPSRPPQGIRPAYVVREDRMLEIQRAMNRYMAEGLPVPVEWISEYNAIAKLRKV